MKARCVWQKVLLPFIQNKENVLDVLNEHIEQLKKFRDRIEESNEQELRGLIEHANNIRRIIK